MPARAAFQTSRIHKPKCFLMNDWQNRALFEFDFAKFDTTVEIPSKRKKRNEAVTQRCLQTDLVFGGVTQDVGVGASARAIRRLLAQSKRFLNAFNKT